MRVFQVERVEGIMYCEPYMMIIVAEDEKHAERKARWESDYFKKCKNIKTTEIQLDKEKVIATDYMEG